MEYFLNSLSQSYNCVLDSVVHFPRENVFETYVNIRGDDMILENSPSCFRKAQRGTNNANFTFLIFTSMKTFILMSH